MSIHGWRRFEEVVRRRADHPALIMGDNRVGFRALRDAALAQAAGLDVQPGDRVVISGANGIGVATAILATWRRGAIPVLLHPEMPAHHVRHAAAVTRPAAAWIEGDGVASGLDGLPRVETPASAGGPLPAEPRQSPNEPASILFTSGSTGLPKGVAQSAANLIGGASRVAAYLGYRDDDAILCAIPFAFDYGWGQLLSAFLEGVPLILPAQGNAFGICQAIADHRPTVIAGVPSLMGDLLSGLSPIRETDTSCIRLITNTGSKVPPGLFQSIREVFPTSALSLNYGLTETYRSASLPVDLADQFPTSVGFAIPGVDLVVLRPDGAPAAAGEEGEIVHRGAGVFLGYWGEPERTAEVLRPDPLWTHPEVAAPMVVFTGDLGHVDESGRLYIHGRRDGQMKCMGVRVSRDEIEHLLHDTGLVDEAAVVAKPHDVLGDMIIAFVVPKTADGEAGLRELKRAMRDATNRFMQPRLYQVVERLPRNPNGKVDYPALRTMVETVA